MSSDPWDTHAWTCDRRSWALILELRMMIRSPRRPMVGLFAVDYAWPQFFLLPERPLLRQIEESDSQDSINCQQLHTFHPVGFAVLGHDGHDSD